MACYHPLDAFERQSGRTGRKVIAFRLPGKPLQLPCGQCIGCRLDRSRMWAIRIMHEAQMHDGNCFITLTYDDGNVPIDGSLVKHHFQDFMKRLRRSLGSRKIRYFMCGEYGELLKRPHYHACIFGFDFPDRELHSQRDDISLFTSGHLAERWGKGFCTVGDLTFESAAYCARYITKKVNGQAAFEHYINDDGVQLEPEYTTMSRGGKNGRGIGYDWFDNFASDVFPWDEVILKGHPVKPPRYYTDILAVADPVSHDQVKAVRLEKAKRMAKDCTPDRLRQRETVKLAQFKQLKRSYENEA